MLANGLPAGVADQQLSIYGHGTGLRDQRLSTRMTTQGYRLSGEFSAPGLQRLFTRSDVRLIPLEAMSVYGGTSGGPVVSTQGVIGVFSGSLNEGGTLAWAIPVEYVDAAVPVKRRAQDIQTWPPLALMDSRARLLRRAIATASAIRRRLDEYFQAIASYETRSRELTVAGGRARPALVLARTVVSQGGRSADVTSDEVGKMYTDRMAEFATACDAADAAYIALMDGVRELNASMEADRSIPRTQRNEDILSRVERDAADIGARLQNLYDLVRQQNDTAKTLTVDLVKMPPDMSARDQMNAILGIQEKLISLALDLPGANTRREIIRLHRSLADLVEASLLSDLDTQEDPWRYTRSPMFELAFKPGWELISPQTSRSSNTGPTQQLPDPIATFGRWSPTSQGAELVLTIDTFDAPGGITDALLAEQSRSLAASFTAVSVRRGIVLGRPAMESFFTYKTGENWYQRYAIQLTAPNQPRGLTLMCDIGLKRAERVQSECQDVLAGFKWK
jgi:hypothetical protein